LAVRFWYKAFEPSVRPVSIEVLLKVSKLCLKVGSRPEKRLVQTLLPNRPDQPFDEWMRERHSRDSFDFDDLQDAEVRLPLMESI
jgi:hypothetical protein